MDHPKRVAGQHVRACIADVGCPCAFEPTCTRAGRQDLGAKIPARASPAKFNPFLEKARQGHREGGAILSWVLRDWLTPILHTLANRVKAITARLFSIHRKSQSASTQYGQMQKVLTNIRKRPSKHSNLTRTLSHYSQFTVSFCCICLPSLLLLNIVQFIVFLTSAFNLLAFKDSRQND